MNCWLASIALASFAWNAAWAAPSCAPTPALGTQHYPGARAITPSNDLTRAAGKATSSPGERLVLHGRLLDSQCLPLQGVAIELWQANAYGHWRVAAPDERVNSSVIFNGAGRTVTDGDGNFTFISVFPGSGKGVAPRLYVHVHRPDGRASFNTQLFFGEDWRNARDATYKRLNTAARQGVTMQMQPAEQGYSATHTIVLPIKARYRSY